MLRETEVRKNSYKKAYSMILTEINNYEASEAEIIQVPRST